MIGTAIAGASGLTGQLVLNRLLDHGNFDPVVAILRKPMHRSHPRLREKVVEFTSLDALPPMPVATAICCLGTTIRKAGTQEAFRAVDHTYSIAFAKWAKASGARHFLLLSSVGADPKSGNFYLRVKGETEAEMAALGFERLDIFQPSLLLGDRSERRFAEQIGQVVAPAFNWALAGSLERYRSIPAATVAAAMAARAIRPTPEPGVHRYEWRQIVELVNV